MVLSEGGLIATDIIVVILSFLVVCSSTFGLVRRAKSQTAPVKSSERIATVLLVLSFIAVVVQSGLYQTYMKRVKETKGQKFTVIVDGAEMSLGYKSLEEPNKINYITFLLQTLSLWLIKGSYLATFLAISHRFNSKALRTRIFALGGYMVVSYLLTLFLDLFWCGKPADVFRPLSECSPYAIPPFTVKFAMTLSTDLGLVILGAYIAHLFSRTSTNRSALTLSLTLVFSIGFMSIIASCLRYTYNYKFTTTDDIDYIMANSSYFSFWMKVEILFAMVAYGIVAVRGAEKENVAEMREKRISEEA